MSERTFTAYEGTEPYLFVSYAHDDDDVVLAEMAWLHESGIRFWYDDGIHPGEVWRQAVVDALSGCSGVVFFATEASTASQNCLQELNFALDEGKAVFVVKLDDAEMPDILRLSLSDRQALIKSRFDEVTYRARLISAVSACLGGEPQSAAAAPVARPKRLSGNRVALVSVGLIVLMIALGTVSYLELGELEPGETTLDGGLDKSIAVMPFVNISRDEASEPFTLGVYRDVLTQISRIEAVRTISRTSAMRFADSELTAPQIGEELGVATILEGSVQRAGSQLRINVRLIDVASDQHIWAENYDRELTAENLFAIQSGIASEVAERLQATLLPAERAALNEVPTMSLDAYDLYLKGRHYYHKADGESVARASGYFEAALEAAPELVLALADAKIRMVATRQLHGDEAYPIVQDAIDRALAIDDQSSEAWTSLGILRGHQADWHASISALRRAVELDPGNFWPHAMLFGSLNAIREYQAALVALKKAYALEPMSLSINLMMARFYQRSGDLDLARHHYERAMQLGADATSMQITIADLESASGKFAAAVVRLREVLESDPQNASAMLRLAYTYLRLRDLESGREWGLRTEALVPAEIEPMASVIGAEGNYRGAITYVEDKLAIGGSRQAPVELLYLFCAAYQGKDTTTARRYLAEYREAAGGGIRIAPQEIDHGMVLTMVEFMLVEGDDAERAEGAELAASILASLTSLHEQGFRHPATLHSLAVANALTGDGDAAREFSDQAVAAGWSDGPFYASRTLNELLGVNQIDSPASLARADRERARLEDKDLAPFSPTERIPVGVKLDVLNAYVGYYTDGNLNMRVFIERNSLMFVFGQRMRPARLLASSERSFYSPLHGYRIEFVSDTSEEVGGLVMSRGRGEIRYKAVPAPPEPVALQPEVVQRYVGSYRWDRRPDLDDSEKRASDYWGLEVSVDADGQVWFNYDNQPALRAQAFSETGFFLPGFYSETRFELDRRTHEVSRLVTTLNGKERIFAPYDGP